jgi:two-component system OmpR family response regulator
MSQEARVLIVDDEPAHRAFVKLVLEAAGWTVDEAIDGASALIAVAAARYAVVLLDIGMPGLDGFEVARAIRGGRDTESAIPIIAFTSLSGASLASRAAAAGMDGHFGKPISAPALIERLEPWWPLPVSAVRTRLVATFGDVEIAALNTSLRAQLADALERIDDPDVAPLAHRIAGVAGTLGFMDVHEAWLALSEGEDGARDRALSTARRTLHALAPPAGSADPL